ncbi:MAG: ribonuclease R [Betaproteobacteria bacterium]|nr:MAG: ribonuclease R [Betaproteobacteria bacterium]
MADTAAETPSTASRPKPRGRGQKTALRWQDPHLERERAKYDDPMPSREFLLSLLEQAGEPVEADAFAQQLGMEAHEEESFRRRLHAMNRDGQLMFNRRGLLCLPQKIEARAGRVDGHPDGFGFFIPDDASGDLRLSEKEMHQVLHGDRVMAREHGADHRGRREGKIIEVLERAHTKPVVGRFYIEHGHQWVIAENPRINQDIVVPKGNEGHAVFGQVVMVEIVEFPSKHTPCIGRIHEVLGGYADSGMEIEIALRKHSLPFEFPPAVAKEAKQLPTTVSAADLGQTPEGLTREDVRALPLVTIDGEDARDFDDAVYCTPEGRGFRLFVAIADVSQYVRPGAPLDAEAYNRSTSVYFPRRVIPMLPEELSNGLCSLNPAVDRLCMVCEMEITSAGRIKKHRFYPAVMHSKARLTYNQVWDWLSDTSQMPADKTTLLPDLQNLHTLFKLLLKARGERGAIEFETLETKMVFNDAGKIERIVPTSRNDAHKMIEECMLAANVCASEFLQKKKHATLYRVHEGPTQIKLEKLHAFLAEFGLHLGGGDEPHAKDYATLLSKVKGRPDEQLLQTVMLRSLHQAVYSPENVGHFGLAYESYTHFTSPIRRYPDLLVHRAIKAGLAGTHYKPGSWEAIGVHCSGNERRADEASRDVTAWLKCFYMQDHLGFEYDGVISGVTSFGIFVSLTEVFVEGLVHVSELGTDYFHFDAARHQMLGERTATRYRLGDKVRIKVVRVDLDTAKIDFTLVTEPVEKIAESTPSKPKAATAKKPATKPATKPAAAKASTKASPKAAKAKS